MKEGTTKGQAKETLRDIEARIARQSFLHEKRTLTFAEVANGWLEHKKPNIRATTWKMYEGYIRNHFADLNYIRIDMITISTIEKWIAIRQSDVT